MRTARAGWASSSAIVLQTLGSPPRNHHRLLSPGWTRPDRRLATDAVDDAYDLSWNADLPEDPIRAIPAASARAFRSVVKGAELPRLTPHGLRHTFATLGLDAGADVLDVAPILRHSSPAITQSIYQHTRPERLRGAARAIETAIFG